MRAVTAAIDKIKQAGFTHIKFELECNLNRSEAEGEAVPCGNCEDGRGFCEYCSDGREACSECDGDGALATTTNGVTVEVECSECDGQGSWDCTECNGQGAWDCELCDGSGEVRQSRWTERKCHQFIIEQLTPKARKAIVYSRFYNDGSVDSELTFTLPISKALYVTEFMAAFNKLGEAIGYGVNTNGAGFHICLLPSSIYPNSDVSLPAGNLANFKRQVTKLLPALYFMASHNHKSRPLHFRQPQISHSDKYSAIYTRNGTCLEYRVFECCYNNPDAVKDYIQTIANTLEYYIHPNKRVKSQNIEFIMNTNGLNLSRWYNDLASAQALNKTLPLIKPNKSMAKLKAERQIEPITKLKDRERKDRLKLYQDWLAYLKNRDLVLSVSKDQVERVALEFQVVRQLSKANAKAAAMRQLSLERLSFREFAANAKAKKGYKVKI